MKKRIAGCIILYNPDTDIVSNIETFAPELAVFIVIDNSPVDHRDMIRRLDPSSNIVYLWSGVNEGIAKALNLACATAMQQQCDWLLTMDQDSRFKPGDFPKLVAAIDIAGKEYPNIGILTPYHDVQEQFRRVPGQRFTTISGAMTSGNLLSLEAYRRTGPFEEKLFIDYVDHEYCLRLRKNNFAIVQYNEVLLEHALGDFKIKSVFGRKMGVSNHNHIRRYYKVRNGLYTVQKHFSFDKPFGLEILRNLFTDFLKIVVFEKNKLLKTGATIRGVWHFIIGRYGKYRQ